MPKAPKTSNNILHRSTPYTTTAPTTIAPAPAMATHSILSSLQPGADRHGSNGSNTWSPENDEKLMRARQQGLNWQPIASQLFPDKTANACRKRHERLMEKRNSADNWDGIKMDAMAKAYVELREQMWQLLADRVGEKWQTVEIKCMEKGLKTLQAAGRNASRRERQLNGSDIGSHTGEGDDSFNDSGLGHDQDPSFLHRSHNEHQRSYASSIHNEQQHYPGGTITPPYSRSYSVSSSSNLGSNIVNTSPMALVQQPSPYQHSQTLPSFSSAFGQPSVSSMQSGLHRQSPHHHTAVTTH